MKMLRMLIVFAFAMATILLLLAEPAAAQETGGAPPIPNVTRSPHAAVGYGIMFLLLVAVIAVSIMPSKRGHQD